MADVQKENGFTAIANEIFEAMQMYKLTLNEIKIIMCVWRYTYGFNRKSHQLSLGFFVKHTGLSRSRVNDSLKRLLECNVLIKVGQGNAKTSNVYAFNKNYETWTIEKYSTFTSMQNETSTQIGTSAQDGTSTSVQNGTGTSVQDGTKEIKDKDNIKEIQSQEVFDYYISKNIIQHKKFDSEMKRKTKAQIKKWGIEEIKIAIHNYSIVFHSEDYWFKTKYSLLDILRDKDIRQFGSEADPFFNFAKDKSKVVELKPSKPQKTREQIEHEKMLEEMGME
ncbi:replication protein [Ornithinibacillus xuwenensis]|uniref:Replication protein n=1 Tax=Ornithinibacillus xuwenensis TaxID=3144668 RepID=A0ABU9XBV2_9BACI